MSTYIWRNHETLWCLNKKLNHLRYIIDTKYWMFPYICGFILNYTLVKTFNGCVRCQVILKEIQCCSKNRGLKWYSFSMQYFCHACLTTVRMNFMTFQSKLSSLKMMECYTSEIRRKMWEIKPWNHISSLGITRSYSKCLHYWAFLACWFWPASALSALLLVVSVDLMIIEN